MEAVLNNLGLSVLFAALGLVLLLASYKILDLLTPMDMNKRIFEDGNIAVAILAAGFVIGLAIIIAAAIG